MKPVIAAVVASTLVVLGVPAARAEGDGPVELGPLISGASSYADGTFVWTDYVYDDRGPNTDVFKGGDAAYPDAAPPGNAADLVQLQIGWDDGLTIRAVLNSLVDPAVPSLGVGFDTDLDPTTGAATIPGGAWRPSAPLGLDAFVAVSAAGAELLSWENGSWTSSQLASYAIDAGRNTIDVRVPSALADPGGASRRVYGVLGTASDGEAWRDGSGPVYDLAFVRAEDPYTESAYAGADAAHQVSGQATGRGSGTREWQDHRQADVLAGALHPQNAAALVDLDAVRAGVTRLADAADAGFHTFLYRSGVRLGEGVNLSPRQYRGVYQPYLVRVPGGGLVPGLPLVVFLHGGSQNHLQTANYFAPSFTDTISPGSFDPPAVVIFPLGRDEDWLSGPSEQDFLDAMEDAITRLGLDRERVMVTGISAGGVGSLHYAQSYPDRFSGVYSLAGGTPIGHLSNMSNMAVRITNGLADPAAGVGPTVLLGPAFELLGLVDSRIWLVNMRSHVPIPALGDCVLRELVSTPRVRDPARVVHNVEARLDVVDPERGLHIVRDRAYWVSRIGVRPASGVFGFAVLGQYVDLIGNGRGTIDVTSLARADRARVPSSGRTAYENVTAGRDLCGPNPAVRTGDSWEESAVRLGPGPEQPVSNGMRATLTNIATATLDLPRMQLSTGEELTVEVTGDGPAELRLAGPWTGAVTVSRDGTPLGTVEPQDGAVTIAGDLTGSHVYRLTS